VQTLKTFFVRSKNHRFFIQDADTPSRIQRFSYVTVRLSNSLATADDQKNMKNFLGETNGMNFAQYEISSCQFTRN
jgi:hypothetical protein